MELRRGAIGLMLAFLVVAAPSHAQLPARPPHAVHLRYDAPAECPDDASLIQLVEEFLGQSLSQAGEQPLAIQVVTQGAVEQGYSAKLVFTGADGRQERFLDHPHCEKLTEAAALLVALAIDPERVKARQRDEAPTIVPPTADAPAPVGSALPATEPEAARDKPRRDAPASDVANPAPVQSRVSTTLSVLALANSGLLPSLTPGAGLELEWHYGALAAGIGGHYWATRSAEIPGASSSEVEMSLKSAGIQLCGVPRFGDWTAPLCLRGELGDLQGSGQGVDEPRSRSAPLGALGASWAVSFARYRFAPLLGMQLSWLPSRPRFGVLRDQQEVEAFQPDTLAIGGFFGLACRL